MNLTKAVQEVAKWNEAFQHIPEDDDAREKKIGRASCRERV